MRILLAFSLLFATLPAMADMGVVVSDAGVMVAKEVYGGDTSSLAKTLSARQATTPSLTFQTFDLSVPAQLTTFNASALPSSATDTAIQADVTTINATAVKTSLETAVIDILKKRGIIP